MPASATTSSRFASSSTSASIRFMVWTSFVFRVPNANDTEGHCQFNRLGPAPFALPLICLGIGSTSLGSKPRGPPGDPPTDRLSTLLRRFPLTRPLPGPLSIAQGQPKERQHRSVDTVLAHLASPPRPLPPSSFDTTTPIARYCTRLRFELDGLPRPERRLGCRKPRRHRTRRTGPSPPRKATRSTTCGSGPSRIAASGSRRIRRA